jgi:ABC-2 type transport system permease protein
MTPCPGGLCRPPLISATNALLGIRHVAPAQQPVTSIVDTIRDLVTQQPVSNDIWAALAWCPGLLVIACVLAMATYHRTAA